MRLPILPHPSPFALLVLLVLPGLARAQEPSEPPNIVWLSVEDMSPWIAAYGDRTVPTPHLDRLAREGIVFENAFATSPVCAPARSTLITGLYATRLGTMQMRTGNPSEAALAKDADAYAEIPSYEGVPPEWLRCLPELLRLEGWYTTNHTKTDYQFRAPDTVWDVSGGKAHWRSRAPGQPFFAVFNHTGTHESQAFPGASRAPALVRPESLSLPPFYPDTPAVRDALARTYDNIARMDGWVGERLAELEAADLLESTVVVFFSDHGVGLPRGKRSVYDTGTRVPLLVRLPGRSRAGTRETRVVSFVDFAPTVLSLAGIEADPRLDGTAFLGPHAREGRGLAFAHADRFDAVRELTRSVSDGRFRYVRNFRTDVPHLLPNAYRERLPMTADLYALRAPGAATPEQWQMAGSTRPPEEFYDATSDPWEVRNLVDDPAHAERVARLRAQLERWIEATGDLGFVLPETVLVRERLWPPDGVQPETAAPALRRVADDEVAAGEAISYLVSCGTAGASLGYRIAKDGAFEGAWVPIRTIPGADAGRFRTKLRSGRVQVRAHRIGYRPATRVFALGEG